MKHALPRISFNSSPLIRALAELSIVDVPVLKAFPAEQLGQWLGVTDAIALFSALNPDISTRAETRPSDRSAEGASIRAELSRLQIVLVNSMSADDAFQLGRQARMQSPPSQPDTPIETAAVFSPFRRYYLARQRDMTPPIGALRAKAREALATSSPALRRLAEVDAVLDRALGNRERELFATIPIFLERRFELLRKEHQQAQMETQDKDDPELWIQPGGWLATFFNDMRDVLLAEVEVRLQPVAGLIEAYGNEVIKQK